MYEDCCYGVIVEDNDRCKCLNMLFHNKNDAMIFTMVQVYAIGILPCKNKVIGLIEM